jgi:hypothetical protein
LTLFSRKKDRNYKFLDQIYKTMFQVVNLLLIFRFVVFPIYDSNDSKQQLYYISVEDHTDCKGATFCNFPAFLTEF